MSNKDEINDYMSKRADQERRGETQVSKTFASSENGMSLSHRDKPMVPAVTPDMVPMKKPGLFAGKEDKELYQIGHGARREVFNTQLELLRNQCKAALKEDLAFWDGKSEEVAKRIDAYVSASIQDIEAERAAKTMLVTKKIIMFANQSLADTIGNSDLIPALRDRLVDRVMDEMDKSIEVIKNEDRTKRKS
jgi:hypothetical protein